jgi:IS4 transposase
VAVYLEAQAQAEAIDVFSYLQKNYADDDVIDLPVSLGHERVSCRLLAYRLPEQVIEERRRKALEEARKKGRTLTQAYLNWLTFGLYITNVTREMLSAKVVSIVYSLRWQVELMFKNWKSLLNIHILKGTRPERIKCILYGRLITITMMTLLASYASWYAEAYLKASKSAFCR